MILQVKVGSLKGLWTGSCLGRGFSLIPYPPQGPRPRGCPNAAWLTSSIAWPCLTFRVQTKAAMYILSEAVSTSTDGWLLYAGHFLPILGRDQICPWKQALWHFFWPPCRKSVSPCLCVQVVNQQDPGLFHFLYINITMTTVTFQSRCCAVIYLPECAPVCASLQVCVEKKRRSPWLWPVRESPGHWNWEGGVEPAPRRLFCSAQTSATPPPPPRALPFILWNTRTHLRRCTQASSCEVPRR